MTLRNFANSLTDTPAPTQPTLFVGHGSPMNAILDNAFTQKLTQIGTALEKPKAILVVSAHWETRGTFVSTHPKPPTIYDFGGFPQPLYEIKYPALGAPDFAAQTVALSNDHFKLEANGLWGLDHGAWTILKYLFPKADIPVYQMSMDTALTPAKRLELGQLIGVLRQKGVLIIGSGNVVHNLRRVDFANPEAPPADWAVSFDTFLKEALLSGDRKKLADTVYKDARFREAHPSAEHYFPLLYVAGAAAPKAAPNWLYEGFQHGTLSMRTFTV